ncbi:glycosyltransferase family 4 protein [bacterium]|nr:glycosyltransferase family 4 protein [bacterium]
MRILQVHNRYRSGLGGEDTTVDSERQMLRDFGHDVEQLEVFNGEPPRSPVRAAAAGLQAIWSAGSYHQMADTVRRVQPDIVHVHNTFHRLTPSIFWALNALQTPCVVTLQNYRTTCAAALLCRDGSPCEACVGRFPWAALRHRCRYAESLGAGLMIASTQVAHQWLGTYRRRVPGFIVLTEFQKQLMVRTGMPLDRIHVKPNFVHAPATPVDTAAPRHRQVVYVGQIVRAKGVDLLLEAWQRLAPTGWKLVLVGDGPDLPGWQQAYPDSDALLWAGRRTREETMAIVSQSSLLVLPSRWYEGMPLVLLEAMAAGTPVLVPQHGAFLSMLHDEAEGRFFAPCDAASLEATLREMLAADETQWRRWREGAWAAWQELYTPEANHRQLMDIYDRVIARVRG